MAIFRPKPWVNPFRKITIFDCLNFLFLYSSKALFRSRISWKTFFWPILPKKKKFKKWPLLDQNHGLTPLEKCQFSTPWTSCFCCLERGFFALEFDERHFPGLYCLKKKIGKMVIFGRKPWVNPFEKMSIFGLFEHLVFIA